MMLIGQFVTGLLLGGMVYVTALVAPIIFIVLDDPEATEFTRTMWPRYFTLNAVLALLAALVVVAVSPDVYLVAPLFLTAVFMGLNWELARRMRNTRDPGDDQAASYAWMHRFTVWSNALCILLVGGFFGYTLI